MNCYSFSERHQPCTPRVLMPCALFTCFLWGISLSAQSLRTTALLSAAMAGDRFTVSARSEKSRLTHRYYDQVKGRWTDWIEIDGPFGDPVAAMEVDDLIVSQRLKQGVYNATAAHRSKRTSSCPSVELALILLETMDSPRNTALTRQYIENVFFSPCEVGNYFIENSWATFQPRIAAIANFVSVQKN